MGAAVGNACKDLSGAGATVHARSCLTLHNLMVTKTSSAHEFSSQEYWSGLPFPPPGTVCQG